MVWRSHSQGRTVLVRVDGTTDPLMADVADAVATATGGSVQHLDIPTDRLPRRLSRSDRWLRDAFAATPGPLIASWRVARQLERRTRAGDVVVLPDTDGHAGMFAVEQRMRSPGDRRHVVIGAGHSLVLELAAIGPVTGRLPDDDEYRIDWELAAYRFAELVVACSPAAMAALEQFGCASQLVVPAAQPPRSPSRTGGWPLRVRIPEPVSRRARTPQILRALTGLLARGTPIAVAISDDDRPDRVWTGTSWDALAGVRAVLGETITRTAVSEPGDVVIVGDPFLPPPDEVVHHRDRGARVLAAEGSVAASMWPDAETWTNEDDLERLLGGDTAPPGREPAPDRRGHLAPPVAAWDAERASQVSVAVPVFRDVRFLDECLSSVLGQDQVPHEVILVDDGSGSAEVDRCLDRWREREPELVRILRQPNRGVSAARNLALEHMTGDAFVFIDQDDELRPTFLSRCAEALRANPDVTAVATWTEFFGAYAGVEAKPPFDARVGMRENPIVSTCVLV
ncbi:MAG: glycosyltransferase family 2 protein, partial [Actinomycetota bacterium]|nr:glycosyltransferase family 2 protein [Actinomycetota bacterium]